MATQEKIIHRDLRLRVEGRGPDTSQPDTLTRCLNRSGKVNLPQYLRLGSLLIPVTEINSGHDKAYKRETKANQPEYIVSELPAVQHVICVSFEG